MFEKAKPDGLIQVISSKVKYILDWSHKAKAVWISQDEFTGLMNSDINLDDKVAISIVTDSEDVFTINGNWHDKLQLVFHDTMNPDTGIKQSQVTDLWHFIEQNKDKKFCCHCLAGISRSAGVAIFINELFVENFETNYSLYNKLVYSKLRQVYFKNMYRD
jgi:hypothetical protein